MGDGRDDILAAGQTFSTICSYVVAAVVGQSLNGVQ